MKPVIIASIHWINTCTTTCWLLIQWTFHRTSYSVSWPWWGAAWQSSSPGERSETGCLLMWSPNGNIMDNISEDVKRLDELWNPGRTYLKICQKHQLRQGMTMSQNFPCDSAPVPPASSANPAGFSENFQLHLLFLVRFTQGIFGNDPLANFQSSQQPIHSHPFPTFSTSKYFLHISTVLPYVQPS